MENQTNSKKFIRFEIPTSSTSRREEIEIVEKIVNSLAGTQSYMESLFSKELYEYFSSNVSNDFSSNIMAYVKDLSSRLSTAEQNSRDLYDTNKNLIDENEKLANKIQEHANSYKASYDAMNRNLERQYEINVEQAGRTEMFVTERDHALEEIDELNNTIVNLKAKLYDLMVK